MPDAPIIAILLPEATGEAAWRTELKDARSEIPGWLRDVGAVRDGALDGRPLTLVVGINATTRGFGVNAIASRLILPGSSVIRGPCAVLGPRWTSIDAESIRMLLEESNR